MTTIDIATESLTASAEDIATNVEAIETLTGAGESAEESTETLAVASEKAARFVLDGTGKLTSQEGQRGRPRKQGRVFVLGQNEGDTLDILKVRQALAEHYGMKLSQVQHYTPDMKRDGLLSFRVPGIPADDAVVLTFLG